MNQEQLDMLKSAGKTHPVVVELPGMGSVTVDVPSGLDPQTEAAITAQLSGKAMQQHIAAQQGNGRDGYTAALLRELRSQKAHAQPRNKHGDFKR